jgi:hypothetical protein
MAHRPGVRVETYKSSRDYRLDAERMARDGWRVVSAIEQQPRHGHGRFLFRVLTLGIGALLFPRRPEIVVTYERGGRGSGVDDLTWFDAE